MSDGKFTAFTPAQTTTSALLFRRCRASAMAGRAKRLPESTQETVIPRRTFLGPGHSAHTGQPLDSLAGVSGFRARRQTRAPGWPTWCLARL